MIDKVFCNIPWFEVHINADGTYHSCGAQPNRITGNATASQYNVNNMTIPEWVNSQYQRNARVNKLEGVSEPLCNMCYTEEELGSSSKRVKENHKSGISTIKFHETFDASQHHSHFVESAESGYTSLRPNSYHISLGNECNLACKMCVPWASSKVAAIQIKEGTYTGPIRMNWTDNEDAWNHVLDYICSTDNLEYIHLIGGEPLVTPRFEEFIDRLLAAGKTNIYLGFTTNGTIFNEQLVLKLNQFRHVDIGVSVECMGELNDYIRQGSATQTVLDNIDLYLKHRKESHVYVTLRVVPSALSVHTLDELYRWCLDRKLDVMSNMLVNPPYLQIKNLPIDVKQRLLVQYKHWHFTEPFPGESNPRDPNRYKDHIDSEIKAIIKALDQPNDDHQTDILYDKLTLWHWLQHEEIAKYFETITRG